MKILQVTPRYYPSLGGVEETVRHYSEFLQEKFNHEVTVMTSDLDSDGTKIVNGVEVQRLFSLPLFRNGPFLPITPFLGLRILPSSFDLWHLHANKRFTTDLTALLQPLKKTPFVFSPYAGMFGSTLLGRLHNRTIGKLAFRAQVTIVISEFEKKLIENSGMKVKRFATLPIGVDVKEFQKADMSVFSKLNLEGKKVVLFVGRLTKHKGVDTLIKAMPMILKQEPDAHILVVGPDFGERLGFEKMAQDLRLTHKITFSGSLSREELLGCYRNAAVFCLPSRSEAFGIVMIEAMAAGLPVVAANNTAMPEIIHDGQNGLLFETENSAELAAKISTLLQDQKLRGDLINYASSEVAEKYNWSEIVTKLNSLYKEVVS